MRVALYNELIGKAIADSLKTFLLAVSQEGSDHFFSVAGQKSFGRLRKAVSSTVRYLIVRLRIKALISPHLVCM